MRMDISAKTFLEHSRSSINGCPLFSSMYHVAPVSISLEYFVYVINTLISQETETSV